MPIKKRYLAPVPVGAGLALLVAGPAMAATGGFKLTIDGAASAKGTWTTGNFHGRYVRVDADVYDTKIDSKCAYLKVSIKNRLWSDTQGYGKAVCRTGSAGAQQHQVLQVPEVQSSTGFKIEVCLGNYVPDPSIYEAHMVCPSAAREDHGW